MSSACGAQKKRWDHKIERAAVEEARVQAATWSQVAEALNRIRQAVEQRFG
jgi:hypothetical protein